MNSITLLQPVAIIYSCFGTISESLSNIQLLQLLTLTVCMSLAKFTCSDVIKTTTCCVIIQSLPRLHYFHIRRQANEGMHQRAETDITERDDIIDR